MAAAFLREGGGHRSFIFNPEKCVDGLLPLRISHIRLESVIGKVQTTNRRERHRRRDENRFSVQASLRYAKFDRSRPTSLK